MESTSSRRAARSQPPLITAGSGERQRVPNADDAATSQMLAGADRLHSSAQLIDAVRNLVTILTLIALILAVPVAIAAFRWAL